MWVRESLGVLCLALAATDGCSPERCYFRGGRRGRAGDQSEGENERPALLASSSHLDFAKTVYFYVALERGPRLHPFPVVKPGRHRFCLGVA